MAAIIEDELARCPKLTRDEIFNKLQTRYEICAACMTCQPDIKTRINNRINQ